jgi:hypothetical protein
MQDLTASRQLDAATPIRAQRQGRQQKEPRLTERRLET